MERLLRIAIPEPETGDEREVYAFAGLALFEAQVLEQSAIQLLVVRKQVRFPASPETKLMLCSAKQKRTHSAACSLLSGTTSHRQEGEAALTCSHRPPKLSRASILRPARPPNSVLMLAACHDRRTARSCRPLPRRWSDSGRPSHPTATTTWCFGGRH